MHPNPAFRGETREDQLTFARARAFGTLAVNADPAPLLSHIPFLLDATGETADLHLVRSNPIARLGAIPAVISVSGPDGYVSPDWYDVPDQVPTWNYVAVHLRGPLEPLDPATMRDMLDRQSTHFEDQLLPKTPWTTTKMTPEVLDRMMRQILPFRLHIEEVHGTWKLNQNKDDAVRLRAADQMETGSGQELAALAGLMRAVPGKDG
ncbi:MAG: FMN-binding negative transcriptional regulator [Pseudomonadota bacterium]